MMRLSDVAEIDLPAAFVDKMAKNREYIRPSRSIARRQSTPSTVPRREERPQRGETAAERPQRGGPRSTGGAGGEAGGRCGAGAGGAGRAGCGQARVGRANQRGRSLRACRRESRAADREEAASVAASESTTPAAASDGAPARGVWWRSTRRRGRVASVSAPGPKQASIRMGSRATPPTTTRRPYSKHIRLPRMVPACGNDMI